MSYVPISLKYRPRNFDEVVGQMHITTTLKNAISLDKVARAYLFAGPRGTGKTTTARILAKSLNCKNAPTPAPCSECPSCVDISKGRSMDVLEIDGASNRGIDEIRNLRESVKFMSSGGNFRIYIIDEVHMLTTEAFNALLKTLEEPPTHVKFIFATTQSHKVLPTITSRCQKFDFRRLSVQDITGNLRSIAKKENINISDEALFLIAKSTDGSMRDAQVILDQLNTFSKTKIEISSVRELLGIIPQDAFFAFADGIITKDAQGILKVLDELIADGKEAFPITVGLVNHFRNMMVLKLSGDYSKYVILSDDDMRRLEEQAKYFSLEDILYIIYTLTGAMDLIRKTSLARIPLEVALVKVVQAARIQPVTELIEKVSRLENSISRWQDLKTKGEEVITEPAVPPSPPLPPEAADSTEAASPGTASARTVLPGSGEGELFQEIKSRWYEIMNYVKNKKMSVATFLSEANPVELKDNKLIIGFSKQASFHKELLESNNNRKVIQDAVSEIIKKDVGIDFTILEYTVEEESAAEAVSGDIDDALGRSKKVEPIVESALDIFNGRVIKRQDREK